MLWKVWLLVESDQGTNGPTKGQGHLLSSSGQLKTTYPPTYLPPLENTLKEWSFTVVFLVMVDIICLHTFTFTKETMYFVTSPVIVHLISLSQQTPCCFPVIVPLPIISICVMSKIKILLLFAILAMFPEELQYWCHIKALWKRYQQNCIHARARWGRFEVNLPI